MTGAAGFIGGKLVEALIAGGRSVEGVDSFVTGRKDRLPSGVIIHKLDLVKASDKTLLEVLDGAKTLYHLAAIKKHNRVNNPKLLVETNFVSAQNLFRLARISGIERIIYTSSLYAYGKMNGDRFEESMLPVAQSYYGTTKLCSE